LEPAELRTARCTMFGQCLVDLIGVLVVLMRYPEDVEELSQDEVRYSFRFTLSFPPRVPNLCLSVSIELPPRFLAV